MRTLFACLMLLTLGALVAVAEAQTSDDRALRSRIEARYDVVPIATASPSRRKPVTTTCG